QVAGQDYYTMATPTVYYTRTEPIQAFRGEIYDRNGTPLVTNQYTYNLQLDYGSFPKKEADKNALLCRAMAILSDHEITPNAPGTTPFVISTGENSVSFRYDDAFFDTVKGRRYEKLIDGMNLDDVQDVDACVHGLMERYALIDEDGELLYTPEETAMLVTYRLDMELSNFSAVEPYTIAEDISLAAVSQAEEDLTRGILVTTVLTRHYEYPGYASHILGRIGKVPSGSEDYYLDRGYTLDDVVGLDGVEKAFEESLRGVDGERTITEDSYGNIIKTEVTREPLAGADVYMTIDIGMQIEAENALATTVQRIRDEADPSRPLTGEDASAGAIVATDVSSGDILAIASYPTYSLATFSQDFATLNSDERQPMYNRALFGTYAPGSTFKVGVAIAALEEEIIEKDTIINAQGKYTYYSDYQPECWIYAYGGVHGYINVTEAIQESCNYFFYEVGRLLTIEKMNAHMKNFGFGEATGIELPEKTGILAGPDYRNDNGLGKWSPGDTLQAAIGQSDNVFTPLQINMYLTTVLNRGKRYSAHLLDRIMSYDGGVLEESTPTVLSEETFSEEIFETVKEGMKNVMDNGSAARVFSGYPIPVGGKTGTAQIYKTKSDNAIMTAFAPYDAPKIAVTCVIEQGASGTNAGYAIKDIFDYYFELE
ncbi:MAG: penicillin-binding transpeptidase domain-containing protein, partial [Eubacteriales bacterium]|nr:penicillin-binding transpeptidase domain-containing protein [Eubacteriales bacterium]